MKVGILYHMFFCMKGSIYLDMYVLPRIHVVENLYFLHSATLPAQSNAVSKSSLSVFFDNTQSIINWRLVLESSTNNNTKYSNTTLFPSLHLEHRSL